MKLSCSSEKLPSLQTEFELQSLYKGLGAFKYLITKINWNIYFFKYIKKQQQEKQENRKTKAKKKKGEKKRKEKQKKRKEQYKKKESNKKNKWKLLIYLW